MGEFRVHQIRLQKSSIDLYSNVPGGAFSIRTSTPPKVKIEFGKTHRSVQTFASCELPGSCI